MQARFFFHALSGQLKLPSAFDMKESLEFRRCDMSMNYVKSRRHAQIVSSFFVRGGIFARMRTSSLDAFSHELNKAWEKSYMEHNRLGKGRK